MWMCMEPLVKGQLIDGENLTVYLLLLVHQKAKFVEYPSVKRKKNAYHLEGPNSLYNRIERRLQGIQQEMSSRALYYNHLFHCETSVAESCVGTRLVEGHRVRLYVFFVGVDVCVYACFNPCNPELKILQFPFINPLYYFFQV